MKNYVKIVVFYFLLKNCVFIFADNNEHAADEKSLYPALVGGLFTNTIFHLTGRLFGADFAQTTPESIQSNLSSAWVWDNDAFLFNHPGHPYQGGLYHASARSNGFTFYESLFFTGLGSLTWELFGETETPSLNDLIVTTFGGAAFGEMLHLLYLETKSPWAGILVSPMDSLNNAVLRKKPEKTNNMYYLSTMIGLSWIRSVIDDRQSWQNNDNDARLTQIYTADMGVNVMYGDPFIQNSKKPYAHFEINAKIGGSFYAWWFDWIIITDGYLRSFTVLDTERDKLSTGLTLHYDLITGSNVNFASNALDWSVKWRREYRNTVFELKPHAGWTFFGSSEHYPFAEINFDNLVINESENNYGTGGNVKILFTVQNQKMGKFTLGAYNYLLYLIPLNLANSSGIEFFNLSFFEYSYPITGMFSIIVNNTFYIKSGKSNRETNIVSAVNSVFMGCQWTVVNKGAINNPAADR